MGGREPLSATATTKHCREIGASWATRQQQPSIPLPDLTAGAERREVTLTVDGSLATIGLVERNGMIRAKWP